MKTTQTLAAEFAARFPTLAAGLGPDNLKLLLDGAQIQEFPAGRAVIRDRMPVDHIYFVLDGMLNAFIEQGGASMRLADIKPGEWMGEVSVLSGEFVASATVVTLTPCKLLKVHHMTFEKMIAGNETFAKVMLENFIALMAERLRAVYAHE
ncbi:MAG: Crp/Fnr family transcriptional regulator [Burkholderiaceae bacterium]